MVMGIIWQVNGTALHHILQSQKFAFHDHDHVTQMQPDSLSSIAMQAHACARILSSLVMQKISICS